ncbi:MAG: meaB [Segetibacter sp.]|jgi:LAO/AO transport system kinase|nr:meaB [Segetibacter sp.]
MAELVAEISKGSFKALSRAISLVENKAGDYLHILTNLPSDSASVIIGVTGPPGAGKSTIVDALIGEMIASDKKVGVLCVDPSSPFNLGALLGDRIRMNQWYTHPNVFIRSLANRGSLGGLHPSIIEITDVMKASGFDYIIVETVGVGQSEVEIAGLADTTVIVLVPEAGDEVQTMKAGLMEIGDIFVVNKADRPDADAFEKNLKKIFRSSHSHHDVPVIKTIASEQTGIAELFEKIKSHKVSSKGIDKRLWLLTEKAYHLLVAKKMAGINKEEIFNSIKEKLEEDREFNLYKFIEERNIDGYNF